MAECFLWMLGTRKVVIVGPPPVQVLDVTGPLEVFSNAEGYEITIGTPGSERTLETNRQFALTGALPISEIDGQSTAFHAYVCGRPR